MTAELLNLISRVQNNLINANLILTWIWAKDKLKFTNCLQRTNEENNN